MTRLEQIERELKLIYKCEKAYRFWQGLESNGMEIENAYESYYKLIDECSIFDSTICNIISLKAYKQKLLSEKGYIKTKVKNEKFQSWLTKENNKKWMRILGKLSPNTTLAFNKFVENYDLNFKELR